MLAEERQKAILALVTSESRVEVPDLASRFEVSEDTVRRDLRALASAGYLQKTHGGAVALDVPSLAWEARTQLQPAAKAKIGGAAAALVAPQETVILDAGLAALGHTSFAVTARHYVDRVAQERARSRRSRDVLSGNCAPKPVTGAAQTA